ncbi:hemagglutinin repeat-containing protein [Providencia rettgeri]
MNKHCYRIIFNRARQLLMVVADIAKSRVKTPSSSRRSGRSAPDSSLSVTLKPLVWSLALAVGAVSFHTAAAVVADGSAPGNQQPTIIAGANGTPQVNIQSPNSSGVSHNKYQNFDVDNKGVILNNSAVNTQTQLGGLITGNPWLAKGEANVILNEVNSANPSQLNGFVEVAGKRADVIIANPAGITCSGCGFINANKTTLAAAQVLLEQGKIAGFDVKNGQIAIQGNGLNDTQSDYTQLIARAVKINAKLHAKDLSVTTGKNRTDANGKVLSTEATSDTAPEFAIDVASLGGMYANKIRLVGTDKGVGVRNAGELGAAVGDVVLSVDGRIRNAGVITANQHVDIHSQASIENKGTLLAKSDIQLQAKEAITNTQQGQIVSGRDTRLNTNTLQSDNTALLAAGINEKGQLTASGSLTLNAEQSADLHGEVIAKDTLTVTGKTLNLSHANVQAANLHLTASAGDIRMQNGRFLATENATLKAQQQIDNQDGEIAAKNLTLEAQGAMTNTNGRLIATQELTLNSQQLNNVQGVLSSGSHLTVKTGEIDNRQGLISGKSVAIDTQGQQFINQSSQAGQGVFAENSLHLKVGALMNQQGHIQGQHIILDTQQNQIDNTEGEILSTETLNMTSGELNNLRGLVQAGKHLTLDTQGRAINNQQTQQSGGLLSGGDLTVKSGEFNNQQGQVQGGGDTTLTTAQWNNQQGQLLSGGSLQVNTQQHTFLNQNGTVASHGTLNIQVADLDNTQGHLQGNSGIELQAKQINNTAGTLLSQGALNLDVDALDNQQGTIQSQDRATLLVAQDINNNQGKIRSGDNLNIRAQSVNNTQGQLQGVGDVTLTLLHHLNNTAGWVKANQTLTLSSQTVDNTQTGQAGLGLEGQHVTLTAAALDNQQGAIRAGASLQANIHQTLNNTDGLLSAGEALTVTDNTQGAGLTLANTDGVIVSNGEASIIANQLRGEGKLLAQSNLALLIQQAFVNRGRIQAGEKLHIQVAEGLTNLGLISSLGELQLLATNVDNAASGEISGNQTHITVKEAINNTGLIDGQLTHLIGQSLNNVGTGRIYGDIIAIAVKSLINDKQEVQSAVIAGRQSVNIAVSDLLNRDHALIYSDGDLVIGGALDENLNATGRADNVKNHSANIEAAGNLTLKTTTLENKDIHLELTQDAIEVSREHFDWFDFGNGRRYKIQTDEENGVRYAINEDGSLNKNVGIYYTDDFPGVRWRMFENGDWTKDFYEYDYDRIIYETQIIQQDAALITSGKNLTLDGAQLTNENSRIIAGQNLILTGESLNNQETQGIRRVFDDGTTIYRFQCGTIWYTCISRSQHQGLNTSENLALNLMEATENAGNITQIQLNAVKENALDQQAGEVEGSEFNAEPGLNIVEQTLKDNQDVVIKTVGPNITLPDNSLFTLTPNSDSQYLIETDPRFTNNKKWLSSLDIFDSNQLNKRLGDGYYEQKLVRDQLIETTGQRLLGDYDSDEAQYRALLTNGAAFGEKYHLTPGIALSAEQMANLTTDIVWMVNKEITLPDGTIELVSVPQVYVRAREGDLNGNGALLAGKNVAADITGNVLNSGEISSRALTEIRADDIQNSGQLQGHDITLNALKDIKNIGGEIRGTNSVSLSAGRDILSETALRQEGGSSWLDRPASIYVTGDNGELTLKAVQNVNIIASTLASTGENGKATLIAGKNINLDSHDIRNAFNYTQSSNNYYRGAHTTEAGAQIITKGDLTLSSNQDLSSNGSQISSGGLIDANIGRDINIHTSDLTAKEGINLNAGKNVNISNEVIETLYAKNARAAISDRKEQTNHASEIKTSGQLNINAGENLVIQGSSLQSGENSSLSAKNNIELKAQQLEGHKKGKQYTSESKVTIGTQITSQGNLNLTSGNDISGNATKIKAEGSINLDAKNDIALGSSQNFQRKEIIAKRKHEIDESYRQESSELSSGNHISIKSGKNIIGESLLVSAKGDINLSAGENVTLSSQTESDYHYLDETKVKKKNFSKKITRTIEEDFASHEKGSKLSGEKINISSGKNTTIVGSSLVGNHDVKIVADGDLNVSAATEKQSSYRYKKTKKSGLFSGGGLGFTLGSQSSTQKMNQNGYTQSDSMSTIGSLGGDVLISANGSTVLHGSDLISAKDINVSSSDIAISAAQDKRITITSVETKSNGLSVSLGGSVGSALNTAYQTGKAAQETDDDQLKALQGIKAGLKLQQANQAGQLAAAQKPGSDLTNNGSFGIDVSYGSSSSKSTSKTEQQTATSSSLSAGDNITLNATGQKFGSKGNIDIQGSTLNADKDLTLNAKNDINLSSATNTQTVDSKNESKGTTVGAGISAGKGWNVNASVNKGSGFEKGNSQYYTDTEANAGKTLTINSGNDTTLTGAQASGDTVKMNVGGDLTLSSQQVTDKYDSKQTNSSVGGSYSQSGAVSVNVNADKSEMHSDYQSVDNQTGIHAGQGGFDITVGDHTQLDGAVISSDASKDKNRLDTGTIGFNDIENKADYKVEQQSGGYNTGGDIGGQVISNAGSALLAGVNNKGKDSNTTQSAVAEGDIIVRDTDNQTQNVDDLSRDTDNAHEKLGTIFDKDEEQKRIDRNQLIGEIGQQIKDIAVINEKIKATQNVLKNNPELKGDDLEAAIQAEINQSKWGVGGENTRIVDAGTALIQGLANGDVNAAVANASAPYIANYIAKEIGKDNKAGLLTAHAIANVALALAKDENALSQAAGAVTAEAMGMLSQELYKKDVSQLTEEEKSTLSAFASLAAGIAGGLVGGETQDALNAAQAGKTTVENNALGEIVDQLVTGKSQEEKYEDAKKQLKQLTDEFKQKNCAGLSADACSAKMVEHRNELLMGATDFGIDFIPIVGDIKGFAEAQSAIDYLAATVGLIPVLGDSAGKYIKLADKALKEGDIAEASRLINKASDEIVGQLPTPGNVSLPSTGLGSNAKFSVTNEQLGKKLGKHVEDFGGNPSNASDRQYVLDIINDIGSKPDKVIAGKFAGQGIGVGASRGDVFFRIKGNDVVVTKPDGSFVTVLKDGVTNNTSVKNALKGNPQ